MQSVADGPYKNHRFLKRLSHQLPASKMAVIDVPNRKVLDEQNGASRTRTNGDGGRFVFSAIQPGGYTMATEPRVASVKHPEWQTARIRPCGSPAWLDELAEVN